MVPQSRLSARVATIAPEAKAIRSETNSWQAAADFQRTYARRVAEATFEPPADDLCCEWRVILDCGHGLFLYGESELAETYICFICGRQEPPAPEGPDGMPFA